MVELESAFEQQLQSAKLDTVEARFRESLLPAAVNVSHGILRSFGNRHGYNVDPVIESLAEPQIHRSSNRVEAHWGWDHTAAPFFNTGTTFTNPIQGNPILAFEWPDAPPEVREDFADTFPTVFFPQTEPTGLPGSGFVEAGLHWLMREL